MHEYLACGKPLLANVLSGAGRLVEDIGAGVAVDINDPQQVAGALAKLLADERNRQKMGQAGRKAVRSWEETTREILYICRGVVSGAKRDSR
jgi:glycosyltransferase involved in cell wall biosynthesis